VCPHAQMQHEAALVDHKIRCLLVHDHVLLRQGLRRLLEDEPDLEVVSEAENAADALARAAEHHPEIVITDASIFDCAADRAEQLVMQASPQSRVVFLARHNDDLSGVNDGTSCAMQQTSAEELAEMVREAHWGARALREIPRRGPQQWQPSKAHPQVGGLTAREQEVLKLLAEGRTVRSAAGVLGLSVKTVDAHKFNLMRKLGVHNKAELVMWAIQKRVVKIPANY
jgi:two-component system, NarL family, response regulator NreC